jgi:DNA-binding LytR/AlgR family response regulator
MDYLAREERSKCSELQFVTMTCRNSLDFQFTESIWTEREPAFKYDAFSNAIELLEAMKRNAYHILLLDVLMPGLNGIEAAHEIRSFDEEIKIIFLTSSKEFAVESYAVDAHYYMLKPGTAQKLFPILDKIFLEERRGEAALQIKTASGFTRIPYGKIEFLEVFSKKLRFHLADGDVKEIYGTLSDFEDDLLNREEFIKVHRSFISTWLTFSH